MFPGESVVSDYYTRFFENPTIAARAFWKGRRIFMVRKSGGDLDYDFGKIANFILRCEAEAPVVNYGLQWFEEDYVSAEKCRAAGFTVREQAGQFVCAESDFCPTSKIHLLLSNKGQGKSQCAYDYVMGAICRDPGVRVLVIANSVLLCQQAAKRYNFTLYSDDHSYLGACRKLVICVNSLGRVSRANYDIVVFDEFTQAISQFRALCDFSMQTVIMGVLKNLVAKSKKVLLLEQTPSWWITRELLADVPPTLVCAVFPTQKIQVPLEIVEPCLLSDYVTYAARTHETGANVIFWSDSRNAHKIIDVFTQNNISTRAICSASQEKELGGKTVEEFVRSCFEQRIVPIFSPMLTSGVDLHFPNTHLFAAVTTSEVVQKITYKGID